MQSKKRLIISLVVIGFVLTTVVASIVIAFAMSQQSILTTVNITYRAQNLDGAVRASYTVGGVTKKLTAMKAGKPQGENLIFKASDTQNAGTLEFPEDALNLTRENDNIVIQYTYSNTGDKHYIASMSFDANLKYENMNVEYSINGVDYSEHRYAVVVPANTDNKSYWIKITIDDVAKPASFKGDFKWFLEGCNKQTDEYKSLASINFQSTGTSGSYAVSLNGQGYLPNGEVVFPSEINGDRVTTIARSTLSDEQKALIKSVYIPSSVTTIESNAFAGFVNLQSVVFENVTGWKAGSFALAEAELSNAATLLTTTYVTSIWTRS